MVEPSSDEDRSWPAPETSRQVPSVGQRFGRRRIIAGGVKPSSWPWTTATGTAAVAAASKS